MREINLNGYIGGWECYFSDFQYTMDSIPDDEDIVININSYGGEVFQGLAFYNLIKNKRNSSRTITCNALGYAMSAAAFVLMAGDKSTMPENSYLMIHLPQQHIGGESEELRKQADLLDSMTDMIAGIFASKSGIDKQDIIEMMEATTFLTGPQAMERNFIDSLTDEVELTNDFSTFIMPETVKGKIINTFQNHSEMTITDMVKGIFNSGKGSSEKDTKELQESVSELLTKATNSASKEDVQNALKEMNTGITKVFNDFQAKAEKALEDQKTSFESRITEITNELNSVKAKQSGGTGEGHKSKDDEGSGGATNNLKKGEAANGDAILSPDFMNGVLGKIG